MCFPKGFNHDKIALNCFWMIKCHRVHVVFVYSFIMMHLFVAVRNAVDTGDIVKSITDNLICLALLLFLYRFKCLLGYLLPHGVQCKGWIKFDLKWWISVWFLLFYRLKHLLDSYSEEINILEACLKIARGLVTGHVRWWLAFWPSWYNINCQIISMVDEMYFWLDCMVVYSVCFYTRKSSTTLMLYRCVLAQDENSCLIF